MAPKSKAKVKSKENPKKPGTKNVVSPTSHTSQAESKPSETIPLDLQQLILNVFRDSFPDLINDARLTTTLQEVKGHLFNRDFLRAFGQPEYLEVYALRWSPSRALCYAKIFTDVLPLLQRHPGRSQASILFLGGGAGAELVGLAGAISLLEKRQSCNDEQEATSNYYDVTAVDIANWRNVLDTVYDRISSPPRLSEYASAAAKAANRPLLPSQNLEMAFHQSDLLALEGDEIVKLAELLTRTQLISIMFTLNELYSTSIPRTQELLKRIGELAQSGCHLLVIDSPGSYSTISINGKEKEYPMHWLLDYTLLQKNSTTNEANDSENGDWIKLEAEESHWFRLAESLKYPIPLESMRYQLHLYRKT